MRIAFQVSQATTSTPLSRIPQKKTPLSWTSSITLRLMMKTMTKLSQTTTTKTHRILTGHRIKTNQLMTTAPSLKVKLTHITGVRTLTAALLASIDSLKLQKKKSYPSTTTHTRRISTPRRRQVTQTEKTKILTFHTTKRKTTHMHLTTRGTLTAQ